MEVEIKQNDQGQGRILQALYGNNLQAQISQTNILIVGVGGIGCELLKNLTKTGFKKFTLIDLDTIEFSNLNRQFYFRKHHVKKSKSEVAKEKVLEIAPDCEIIAYCENLFNQKFNNTFYKQFNLVFNALDNQEARRYLGRKCIENNIPMIDAGSSGYNGQSWTNVRFRNLCNNCKPPTQQRVFNVCSIRDQPSESIHCVVWAKNLFNMIFGPQENQQDSMEEEKEDEDKELSENNQKLEQGTIGGVFNKPLQNYSEQEYDKITESLFNKVFFDNIQQKLNLNQEEKQKIQQQEENQQNIENKNETNKGFAIKNSKTKQTLFPLSYQEQIQKFQSINFENIKGLDDERIKNIEEYANDFKNSFINVLKYRKQDIGQIQYDKDDIIAHKFVAAATNLRVHNFRNPNNPLKLQYISARKIKEANIVHAIGSTNAIVSAIQISEALKIIQQQYDKLVYCKVSNSKVNKIQESILDKQEKPKIDCQVCSQKVCYIQIEANFQKVTLKQIRQLMLENFNIPDIYTINNINTGKQIFEVTDNKLYQIKYEQLSNQNLQSFLGQDQQDTQVLDLHFESSKYLWVVNIMNNINIQNEQQIQIFTNPQKILQQQAEYQKLEYKKKQDDTLALYNQYGY